MSLYKSLNITNINATDKEIRRSYYKLAKIHHPDKNKNNDETKFKEITIAYEILSDKNKRYKYNSSLNNEELPFDILIKILDNYGLINLHNKKFIDYILNIIYGNPEKFKLNIINYINNYEFENIYNLFINYKLNIYYNYNLSLDDIYNENYKKINIIRYNNNDKFNDVMVIPINAYTEQLIYENKGDIRNNIKGDLIINFIINDNIFSVLDNFNLLIKTNLFDSIKLPDNTIITKDIDKIISYNNQFELYQYGSKGLINNETNKRGNLYIKNFIK